MTLRIEVVRMPECAPIQGAPVETWHCDTEGAHSGYPEDMGHGPWKTFRVSGRGDENAAPMTEARFLRGARAADQPGLERRRAGAGICARGGAAAGVETAMHLRPDVGEFH